jgi:hypothetical protein
MGAAQGNLAGAEIVEQGACAFQLREVEFPNSLSAGWTLLRLKVHRRVS